MGKSSDTQRFLAEGTRRGIKCCIAKPHDLLYEAARQCVVGQIATGECTHYLWTARYRRLKKSSLKRNVFSEVVGNGKDFEEVWDRILGNEWNGHIAKLSHKLIGAHVSVGNDGRYYASTVFAD